MTLDIETELFLTEKEPLPADTEIFQLDNGILFYYKYSAPQRLYVKWGQRTIAAKLPEEWIGGVGVIGNNVYFDTEQKIYKAAFCPCLGLTIEFVREMEHEHAYCGALTSKERNGKKHVYRMSEVSDIDGILVDAPMEQLKGTRLGGLHRGKIIYTSAKYSANKEPALLELGKNVIVITFPLPGDSYYYSIHISDDYSPFIYINNQESLFTLNMDTMEFLPTLQFKDICIESIAGVNEGIITMSGKISDFRDSGKEWRVLTAELPDGYKFAEDAAWAAAQCDCF